MRSNRILATLVIVASCVTAACSDAADDSANTNASGNVGTDPAVPGKPSVDTPDELPTELVITDLVTGTGRAAEVGDIVVVNYVGVLATDGQEFDSSYEATPIEFTLGTGRVIRGWDAGLVGAQQGTRRQLDIPAELAYGDTPPNGGTGVIKAGAALSFVIDVVAVLPVFEAGDQPQIDVAPAANIPQLQSTDLIVGDGATPRDGTTVAIQIITYRADTGEVLSSEWGNPPLTFAFSAETNVFVGLIAVVDGMRVGGRRQAQIPFVLIFEGEGNPAFGLPPAIDIVVVVDLLAVY